MDEVMEVLGEHVNTIHTIRLDRNPLRLRNILGYQDLRKLLAENHYHIIWTNEPVMGAMTRLTARHTRTKGTKVLYLCHGFHFYKGAGLLSWLAFYPLERFLARFCDCIVCINHEDESVAQHFCVPRVAYIHGIGINTQRFFLTDPHSDIRTSLGLSSGAFLLLSVGELNQNKNHQIILKALAEMHDPSIHYLICGKGALLDHLQEMAIQLGISEQVHFLGYHRDVADIYLQSDVFILPSYREGLSVASLEAMYCGMPLITSRIRGTDDYLQEGISGYLRNADDAVGFADAIHRLRNNMDLCHRYGIRNQKAVLPYCIEYVQQELLHILKTL